MTLLIVHICTMRLLWLLLSAVSAQLLISREVLTPVPAQKALLRVRYTLANNSSEYSPSSPVHNVTIYDPSFNKTNVKFEDLRRRAKLTFGTIKPGEEPYVNLDMFPKAVGLLPLLPFSIKFHRHDMTEAEVTVEESEVLTVASYRDYMMREGGWTHALYAILATVPVGLAPLALSCYLKHQRTLIYKNLKGQ